MKWFILLLILSTLFITSCTISKIEKQPVLEQYIFLKVENNATETKESDYLEPDIKTSPH